MPDTISPMVQPTTDHALTAAEPAPELMAPAAMPSLTAPTVKPEAGQAPKKDYALVTGASSGIGQAFALALAAKKKPLILLGRDETRLKSLSEEIRTRYGVDARFLSIDLARSKDLPQLPGKLKRMGINVDVLVNCAGFGKHGLEADISYEDALNMVNLNCRAVLALTKLFLPEMTARKKGGIINIAAVAGLFPVPYMSNYAATKAFVISYSQALAQEVKNTGVKVMCACPGPTASRFYATAGINAAKYPKLSGLSDPQTIAEQTLKAFKQGKTFALVGEISFWGRFLPKLIPRSLLLRYGASLLGPEQGN